MVNRQLILFLAALLLAPLSFAAGIGDLFDRHGFAIYPASGAVEVRTVASMNGAAANGARAVVPYTGSAFVSKAALASAAVKVARAGSAIGLGWTAWETYKAIKDSGVTTCAPPDFFCAPGPATSSALPAKYSATGTGTLYDSAEAAAAITMKYFYTSNGCTAATNPSYCPTALTGPCVLNYNAAKTSGSYSCPTNAASYPQASGNISNVQQCPSGSTMDGSGKCVTPGTPIPYTSDIDFQTALERGVDGGTQVYPGMPQSGWDSSMYKRLWDAVEADKKARGPQIATTWPGILTMGTERLGANSPMSFSGAPVKTPEQTTSTKVVQNPDGSTSTITTKEQTTFTPGQNGTTVSDAEPVAKESTVVATTTTNNTTNVSNTTTTTNTPAGSSEEKPPEDLCKLHPEIVACQTLGAPFEATPVPDKKVPLAITQNDGWGASNGSCPAPNTFTAQGKTMEFKWDTYCQFATGVRPFFIGMAYFLAIGGFLGLARKD